MLQNYGMISENYVIFTLRAAVHTGYNRQNENELPEGDA
jgi:hypothetical protein